MTSFDYNVAFSRNIGWLTPDEQTKLRNSRIAIAGLGGVGGSHLLTLARLGIGKFNIADFDRFELHNSKRFAAGYGCQREDVGGVIIGRNIVHLTEQGDFVLKAESRHLVRQFRS